MLEQMWGAESSLVQRDSFNLNSANFKSPQNISSFLLLFPSLPAFPLILLGVLKSSHVASILSVTLDNKTLVLHFCFFRSAKK